MSKTTKPISSISYNTEQFLIDTLNTLIICKVILYYEFIKHLPDKDEKKPHIHLYIVPNKSLDLGVFGDYFIEKDLNNELPLKCMPFRCSNFGDWYWYGLHDKDYLKAKQLERNTFYTDTDIVTSDVDFHKQLVAENPLINFAKMSDVAIRDLIFQYVSTGQSLQMLLSTGLIPLGKVNSVIQFYNAMSMYYAPPKERNLPTPKQVKEIKKNIIVDKINHAEAIEHDLLFEE